MKFTLKDQNTTKQELNSRNSSLVTKTQRVQSASWCWENLALNLTLEYEDRSGEYHLNFILPNGISDYVYAPTLDDAVKHTLDEVEFYLKEILEAIEEAREAYFNPE